MTSLRRLIICCDGTACSEFLRDARGQRKLTNVSRIARAIENTRFRPNCNDQPDSNNEYIEQIVMYLPGIGTDGGSPLNHPINYVKQATGQGMELLIKQAYTFLSMNWRPGDEIILIGFSRGAFAMRCLADLLINRGLLPQPQLNLLPKSFEKWKRGQPASLDGTQVRIKVCALWDTVATMGVPLPLRLRRRKQSAFPHVDSFLLDGIDNAFQALSLHEHRYHFQPLVWWHGKGRGENDPKRLVQCWFSGYHGDIGGGRKERVLGNIALLWMMVQLDPYVRFRTHRFWEEEDSGEEDSDGEGPARKFDPKPTHTSDSRWARVRHVFTKPRPEGEGSDVNNFDSKTPRAEEPKDGPDSNDGGKMPASASLDRDSLSGMYRFFGSHARWPCWQFMSSNGFEFRHRQSNESGECIHPTASFLQRRFSETTPNKQGGSLMQPFPSFDRYYHSRVKDPWRLKSGLLRWHRFWPRASELNRSCYVDEQPLSALEIRLMKEWIIYQRKKVYETDKKPGTPGRFHLVEVEKWLGEYGSDN